MRKTAARRTPSKLIAAVKAGAKTARKGDRHQDAVRDLRRMILSGDLAPGEPLREMVFSEQFGISRTPIREAFRTLAGEGLVSLLPNRTVQVSYLDEKAAAEVFTVLGVLESLAARLACQRITPEQLETLSELQEDLQMHFKARDRLRYLDANRRIHELIVQASGNASLALAWRLLLPRAERARHVTTLDQRRWVEAFGEHKEIYKALMRRDADVLAPLMEAHFNNGATSIQREHKRAQAQRRREEFNAA